MNKTNFGWTRVGKFYSSACAYSAISLVEMKAVLKFCKERVPSSLTTTTTRKTTESIVTETIITTDDALTTTETIITTDDAITTTSTPSSNK